MPFGDVPGTQTDSATTNFDRTVQILIQTRLEELLRFPPVHLLPGNFRAATFVKGTNGTMRFLAVGDLAGDAVSSLATPTAGTAPWLTEGAPPAETELTIGYEEMTAHQAGRVIRLTDVALMESPFDLVSVAAERIARDALVVADQYVAGILFAGANRMDVLGGTTAIGSIASTSYLTANAIRLAVARLKANNVPTFADGLYRAIIHPYAAYDLMSDVEVGGWIDASRYAGSEPLLTGELGRFAGVRFLESAGARYTPDASNTLDILSTFVFGPEAYAFGDWGQVQVKVTPPGGHTDPLGQNALIGWKGFFGAVLLGGSDAQTANGIKPRYVRIDSATAAVTGSVIELGPSEL